MLGFIVGAIIFSGITYAVAATIQSSNVSYTTNKNSSITNVRQAIDDLYSKSTLLQGYKYWNDYYSGTSYNSGSASTTIFNSKAAFLSANPNNQYPYIRSKVITENIAGHELCTDYDNKEFCFNETDYWECLGTTYEGRCLVFTTITISNSKLYKAIVNKYGITPSCTTNMGCAAAQGQGVCEYSSISCTWSKNNMQMQIDAGLYGADIRTSVGSTSHICQIVAGTAKCS